jgi:hypothetical protein
MRHSPRGGLVLFGVLSGIGSSATSMQFTPPARDYTLACAGCHGFQGVSNPSLVPNLKGLVGYFLNVPEGRAYLSRLPNVAFSTLSDAQLAAVLNYVVFDLGGASTPAWTAPYRTAEIAKWRRQPLTEVSLTQYRGRLVEDLIEHHGAPQSLRGYAQAYGP